MNNLPNILKDAYKSKFIEEENWSRTNDDGFDFFENIKINWDPDFVTKALITIKKQDRELLRKTGATNKSNTKSAAIRETANSLFKKRQWIEALKNYSKSIAYAENGSIELGFAYANRSALLLHRGFYKECLEDIDRALQLDYPENKKSQLITRKEKATELLSSQKKGVTSDPVPTLPTKNDSLRGASKSIELVEDKTYGRFIRATKDIGLGEIILVENPYVTVTTQDFKTTHCGNCNVLCFNPIPCKKCSNEMYCNEACCDKAYKEYHQYECVIMNFYPPEIFEIPKTPRESKNISNMNKEMLRQLSLRITLKGFRNYQNNILVDPDDAYDDIGKLQTHRADLNKSSLMVLAFNLGKQYHILRNSTGFVSKLKFKDKEDVLKYHLLRNRLICCFSTATILYKLDDSISDETSISTGIGIYPTYSFFNHSCIENVGYSYYGQTMVVRAIRKIKKGEQCFINYGNFFHDQPTFLRNMQLNRFYLFNCKCEACEKDWPVVDKTNLTKKNFELHKATYVMLDETKDMIDSLKQLDEETRQKAFQRCLEIESKMENGPPNLSWVLYYNIMQLITLNRYQGFDF